MHFILPKAYNLYCKESTSNFFFSSETLDRGDAFNSKDIGERAISCLPSSALLLGVTGLKPSCPQARVVSEIGLLGISNLGVLWVLRNTGPTRCNGLLDFELLYI